MMKKQFSKVKTRLNVLQFQSSQFVKKVIKKKIKKVVEDTSEDYWRNTALLLPLNFSPKYDLTRI